MLLYFFSIFVISKIKNIKALDLGANNWIAHNYLQSCFVSYNEPDPLIFKRLKNILENKCKNIYKNCKG